MNKALKTIRIVLAALMLAGVTLLLLDGTGVMRHYVGWIPKVQLLPALMALNVVAVAVILAVTLVVGRVYCSVVCPLGVMQDVFGWIGGLFLKRRYHYRRPATWVRYGVLALFVALMLTGLNGIAILIAPYSAYGRMVTGLFATGLPLAVAIVSLVVIGGLSFRYGRLWCNAVCPVGSLLGLLSRHSAVRVRIDADKCVGCRQCERACKSMCIDIEHKTVDGSRCVDCMNCLGKCKFGALTFGGPGNRDRQGGAKDSPADPSRRKFVAATAAVGAATVLHAQEQKMDGGLAVIEDKAVPKRLVPLKPFGARSLKNFGTRCTGCQLCVSQCPEGVLRPSTELGSLMQPQMAYDRGYCRTACTRCSEVCPAGAIQPISREEKTTISIGIAITLHANCLSARGEQCGACARHCPAAAISMVTDPATGHSLPTVNENRCLGCGACEYYCPARPMTAIYVEGREVHTEV